jgi:hypothetical protein
MAVHMEESRVRVQRVRHGEGCVSCEALAAGEVLLRELPALGLQTPPSRRSVLACGNPKCLAPLPPRAQLALLSGQCSRASLAGAAAGAAEGTAPSAVDPDNAAFSSVAGAGVVWCDGGCGECFCSASCAAQAAPAHRLLCAGPIPDDEPDHPLLRFKLHALRCNEAFLLAAEAVVGLLSEVGADGPAATRRAADRWIRHFQPDGPAVWWDVAQQPEAMRAAGVTQLTFRDSCRANVAASSALLGEALRERAPTMAAAAAPLLEVDGFYGQLLGLFELYSMGVHVQSAIGSLCKQVCEKGTNSEKRALAGQLDACMAAFAAAEDGEDDGCCDEEEDDDEYADTQQLQQEDSRAKGDSSESDGVEQLAKRQKIMSPCESDTAGSGSTYQDEEQQSANDYSSDDELAQCEDFLRAATAGELAYFPPLDATALYSTICKLNHSCDPNCTVEFEEGTAAAAVVKAVRPIDADEELTISYVDANAAEPQRAAALRNYLFCCDCPKCCAERTAAAAAGGDRLPARLMVTGYLPPLQQPRPMDLTENDLTVNLADEEGLVVAGGGCLSRKGVSRAAALLDSAGVVALSGSVVRGDLLEECRLAALRSCDQLETALAARSRADPNGSSSDDGSRPSTGSSAQGGMEEQEPFRYHEICWRGIGRYDVKCDLAKRPWSDPALCKLPFLQPLLRRYLGQDYKLLFAGCVVARPGAATQGLHADGGHLFAQQPLAASEGDAEADEADDVAEDNAEETDETGGGNRYTPLLPAHCVNVFLPLVDLDMEVGPTEFYPGSVGLGTVVPYTEGGCDLPRVRPCVGVSSAIVFDYRLYHRGMANCSRETSRPVLYLTFARSWFTDAENFPPESLSLFAAAAAAAAAAADDDGAS